MGTLTGNRKRYQHMHAISTPDSHVSKKQKFSSANQISNQTLGSSNSTISRISRYPETTMRFAKDVHAPCRVHKYGFSRRRIDDNDEREKLDGYSDVTDSLFSKKDFFVQRRYFGALRSSSKEKEIINFDKEEIDDRMEEVGPSGSGVEEDRKDGDLMVLDPTSRDGGVEEGGKEGDLMVSMRDDGGVDKESENDVKIVEERSVVTSDGNLVPNCTVDSLEAYKELLAKVERRNGKLEELKFQTEYYEKKRTPTELLWPTKKPGEKYVEETPREPFIPLTEEEVAMVNRALSNVNRRKVLVSHKNSCIDITGEILQCLGPRQWLNDEVINLYLELLKEREKREPKKFLKCHFFSTFFYKKLTGGHKNIYDYRAVKRWTTERKLGYFLMDCDKIFVPVHFQEMHWCLAIINKKDQKFQYLDSLKARDSKVLKNLAKYYVEEVKDKCSKDIDVSNWKHEFLDDLPQQQNGFDCGVFMIKYADFYSRGLRLCFGQEHMPYFRSRTAKEILRLRAD